MSSYILSCESTVDMPFSHVNGRGMPVVFYTYMVDGKDYEDDMIRDPEALERFYGMLKDGKMPSTSQINEYNYEQFFEEQLQKGDLLHIVFSRGMSKSIVNAEAAAEAMRKKYPDRKLIVVDSLCASSGYGLLVDLAADQRDAGATIEELEKWLYDNRLKVRHQFYATDLTYLRRGGRVSGPAAMIGTILNICPIMCVDNEGKIIAYGKVRGKMNAIKTTINTMEEQAIGGRDYSGKCYISHSHSIEEAERAKTMIMERFPKVQEVRIFDIGTIIASHTGPGTVAVFYMGSDRTEVK